MKNDLISRQDAIEALREEFKRVPTTAIRAKNVIEGLSSAQPDLQPTCNKVATDCISRQAAIDALDPLFESLAIDKIKALPTAQPDDWLTKNKDKILRAGLEGREWDFFIGGRRFTIREKAQ